MNRTQMLGWMMVLPVSLAAAIPACPQPAPAAVLSFDVASIKPYGPNDMMIGIRTTADGISVTGMPMHMILREAFGVTNDRLFAEPGWVNTSRFDVDAKVAADDAARFKTMTERQRWAMLLPVLQDRCTLRFHTETRDATVYTLVIAKGGLKMQTSTPAHASDQAARRQSGVSVSNKGITLVGHNADMASIAHTISLALGSTVVDKTGLTGAYDYQLDYAPEQPMGLPMRPSDSGDAAAPVGPSIYTALQEQLGLKLQAQKQPVDVIVIDHIEQPSAN